MSRSRIAWVSAFYLIYGALYAGWLVHRSTAPVWRDYSASYVGFLIAAAVPFLLPPLALRALRVLGRRNAGFALASIGIVVAGAYAVASLVYYHTRVHPFDPFLQMYPNETDVPRERTPGVGRILALGGSTTRCGRLAEPDRYPSQLGAILRGRGLPVEVVNAGQDWWTTKHSLIHYVTRARQWHPDVVVIMHAINDMYRSFETPGYTLGRYNDAWTHFYGPAINGAVPPTFEHRLLELPLSSWLSRLRIRPGPMPLEDFRSIDAFETYLRALIDSVRADGARVVLVTQPSLYEPDMTEAARNALWMDKADFVVRKGYFSQRYADPASLHRAMRAYNAVVTKVAAETGTLLAPAAEAVPRDLAHFTDDVHYQPAGARIVAEVVAEAVVATGAVGAARDAATRAP